MTGVPPTPDYTAALAALGIPRTPGATRLLAVACPWCGSGPRTPCFNRAIDAPTQWHEARHEAAGMVPPRRPALADVARRQLQEIQAEREKVRLTNLRGVSESREVVSHTICGTQHEGIA